MTLSHDALLILANAFDGAIASAEQQMKSFGTLQMDERQTDANKAYAASRQEKIRDAIEMIRQYQTSVMSGYWQALKVKS